MYRGEFKRELKSRLVEYYGLYPDEQANLEAVNPVEWISQRVQDLLRDHSFTMSDRDHAVRVQVTISGSSTDRMLPGICCQFRAPRHHQVPQLVLIRERRVHRSTLSRYLCTSCPERDCGSWLCSCASRLFSILWIVLTEKFPGSELSRRMENWYMHSGPIPGEGIWCGLQRHAERDAGAASRSECGSSSTV